MKFSTWPKLSGTDFLSTFTHKEIEEGTYMADQWLGLCAFTAQALVRELRSHMPYGAAKKKKKKKEVEGDFPGGTSG